MNFHAYDYWPQAQAVLAVTRDTALALLELRRRLAAELDLREVAWISGRVRLPQHGAFRAHNTLARNVAQAPVLPAMSPFCWSARSFSLMGSDTRGARSVYTVVDTWPLLDESPSA